jgi:hypothetical protein
LRLFCKYFENPGSSGSYKGLAITGRCVLHSVISAGISNPKKDALTSSTASNNKIITLKDGITDSGDVAMKYVDTLNGYNNSNVYGGDVMIDIPSPGILFENGIYVNLYNGSYGISLVVSGASTTS